MIDKKTLERLVTLYRPHLSTEDLKTYSDAYISFASSPKITKPEDVIAFANHLIQVANECIAINQNKREIMEAAVEYRKVYYTYRRSL